MEISEEQKRAINALKQIDNFDDLCETYYYQDTKRKQLYGCCNCREEAKNIVINLVEKLQKENEEKNKIINSMIKVMIENSICDYFIKEKCKNYAGENGKTCDECIKQYFENKVKEVK